MKLQIGSFIISVSTQPSKQILRRIRIVDPVGILTGIIGNGPDSIVGRILRIQVNASTEPLRHGAYSHHFVDGIIRNHILAN